MARAKAKVKKPRKPMPPGREAIVRNRPRVDLPPPTTGRRIVQAAIGATVLLAITTAVAAVDPRRLGGPALAVALVMFFAGTGALIWSYLIAIGRSRESEIGLAGLYGLSGTAPTEVRVRLIGSAVAQVVIAGIGIAIRPFSNLAFGFLAVMWGIGLTGLWGARHGVFPPRAVAGTAGRAGR